jgi:hypothetical protein
MEGMYFSYGVNNVQGGLVFAAFRMPTPALGILNMSSQQPY